MKFQAQLIVTGTKNQIQKNQAPQKQNGKTAKKPHTTATSTFILTMIGILILLTQTWEILTVEEALDKNHAWIELTADKEKQLTKCAMAVGVLVIG